MTVRTSFSVPFCAGKARPRFSGRHAYKTAAETLHEGAIALAFEEARGEKAPKDKPVNVRIVATKESKRAGEPFTSKPDADNIAKLVLDALNGKAWHDDSQIVSLDVVKADFTENVNRISVDIEWGDV